MSLAAALSKYEERAFGAEPGLAHDLRYLLLGTDSSSFKFTTRSHNGEDGSRVGGLGVEITVDAGSVQQNQLGYLKEFVQLALVVKQLSLETAATPTAFRPSLQAFYACVGESLLRFQQFLNTLYGSGERQSLVSLRYRLDDWLTSFRHIYWLHLKAKTLPAHEFLSVLHQHSLFGDSLIQQLSAGYYTTAFKPYLRLINSWLLLGVLTETEAVREDFFVKPDETRKDFLYFSELVPSFLRQKTAFRIYQVGKSISFLKLYLDDKQWCNEFYNSTSNEDLTALDDALVLRLYEKVISRLDLLLLESYQAEISYLRKFLLLKQGDLIESVIDNGSALLGEPSSSLSSNQLVTLLQDSIESTSVSRNTPPDVYNRLDARLLNINPASSLGWDLFTLDFKLSPPVDRLISSTYKEYLKVFNFLFKISKLNYQLSKSWKKSHLVDNKLKGSFAHNSYSTSKKWNRKMKIHQRKFDLIRHQFISFISSIYSYISNEILSENYHLFQQNFIPKTNQVYQLKNNKLLPLDLSDIQLFNLDELKLIHDSYILPISKSELFYNLNDEKVPLNRILFQLLVTIERFSHLYTEFQSTLADLLRIKHLIAVDSASELNDYQTMLTEKINKISEKLGSDIVDRFENDLTLLINLLKSSSDQSLKCLGQILEN